MDSIAGVVQRCQGIHDRKAKPIPLADTDLNV
jgi:hypothetical protein